MTYDLLEDAVLLNSDYEGAIVLEDPAPAHGGQVDVADKATGDVLFKAGLASPEDVDSAVAITRKAQQDWAQRSPVERGDVLREFARLCGEHQEEIGRWIVRETGSIPPKAPFEVMTSARDALGAAALTEQPQGYILSTSLPRESKARRVPLGVVAVITPWNSPFILAARVILPALAMGNGCVLKPDVQTPVCGGYLFARLVELAGAPKGLVTVVPGAGDVGAALCTHPGVDMVSFTGSTATGRKVGAAAGGSLKKVALELGGNNATIIFPDADMEAVASATAFGSFFHQGQICFTIGRHLVHEDAAEAYATILADKARNLHVGNPATEQVHLGPMINETQAERAEDIYDRSVGMGAEVLYAGGREGLMFKPAVVKGVTKEMPLFEEEIFGPIAPIMTFSTEEEAIELANSVEYGLATSIFTPDLARANRIADGVNTGIVHINDQTVVHEVFGPIGGMNASGNGARSGGPSMADEYSQWQWVTVNDRVPDYPF